MHYGYELTMKLRRGKSSCIPLYVSPAVYKLRVIAGTEVPNTLRPTSNWNNHGPAQRSALQQLHEPVERSTSVATVRPSCRNKSQNTPYGAQKWWQPYHPQPSRLVGAFTRHLLSRNGAPNTTNNVQPRRRSLQFQYKSFGTVIINLSTTLSWRTTCIV